MLVIILSTLGSFGSRSIEETSIGFFVFADITGDFGSSAFLEDLLDLVKSISNPGIGKPTE